MKNKAFPGQNGPLKLDLKKKQEKKGSGVEKGIKPIFSLLVLEMFHIY